MVTTTTVYSFQKPDVSGDQDAWGGYLNANVDKYESILTGNTTITSLVITTADINGGTLDNVVIGGATAAAITGTTITGTSLVGPLATAAQPNITSLGTLTTLTVDDITINGSTISDGGDLTFDVGGDLIIDVDGADVKFKDGGTEFAHLFKSGNNFGIYSAISDGDIQFIGVDGVLGQVTALTLDMSDAGTATFNHDIKLGDNNKALFGASSDLEVYHNGTNSVIYDNGTGNLQLVSGGASVDIIKAGGENMANFATDGAVTLYYDNAVKITTASTGAIILHDNGNYDDGLTLRSTKNWGYGTSLSFDAIATSGGSNATVGKIQSRWQSTGNHALDFYTYGSGYLTKRARLDNEGNLGVGGNTSPSSYNTSAHQLVIGNGSDSQGITIATGTSTYGNIFFADGTSGAAAYSGFIQYTHDTDKLYFGTSGSNRVVIDSSGIDISGDLNAVDNIVLATAMYHEGDTDTFLSFGSGGDSINLVTGGAARLSATNTGIDVTGNVTATHASNATIDAVTTGGATTRISSASTAGYLGTTTNHPALFITNGSERMRIASDGSVGIGTTSPSSHLHVKSTSDNIVATRVSTNSVDALFQSIESASLAQVGTVGSHAFTFFTANQERMRITSAGNVGIGTASPNTYTNYTGLTVNGGSTGSFIDFERSGVFEGEIIATQNQFGVGAVAASGVLTLRSGGNTERMRITSDGSVGIGTTSPSRKLYISGGSGSRADVQLSYDALGTSAGDGVQLGIQASGGYIWNFENSSLYFATNNAERLRIDSSGNFLVGKTSDDFAVEGTAIRGSTSGSKVTITRDGNNALALNRLTSDGAIINFHKDGTTVGSIGSASGNRIYIGTGNSTLGFSPVVDAVYPFSGDDAVDLGTSSARFDDIYATNGTIQTSDRNEKQDIAELTDAEQKVAVAAKGLLRKFRWKAKVAEKGDKARTHFGIIAQDLQAAFAAEGLDAGDYAMFISSTWTDEETGEERTRMGVRYSELLAFIIAAI